MPASPPPTSNPQLQVDALTAAGCYRVFTETASGARTDRPTLQQLLDQLRPGDTLVVWKLDRLGRSLRHLVDTVTGLAERVRVATIDQALAELAAAGAATIEPQTQRWALRSADQHPLLEAVDLHGAHDFRHTFSTWLEDAGIPARVIDELMGHQASGRSGRHQASAIGAHNRHTTSEMAARVVAAIEERLVIVLTTAEAALDQQPW
jgi:hypothetical protein